MNSDQFLWLPRTMREAIAYVALGVLCLMCFISPPSFMLQREQAIKSSLVLAVGMLSWVSIVVYHKYFWPQRFFLSKLLLGIFAASLLLTSLLSADHWQVFFGNTYDRIGAGYLLSLIGVGLVLRTLDGKTVVNSLYVTTLALAVVSIPYNLLFFGHLVRLAGPLRQPDILAVWLGCGFLLGLSVRTWYPRLAKVVRVCQALLIITIVLTGTRAIICFVPLIVLISLWRVTRSRKVIIGTALAAGCLGMLLIIAHAHFDRVNDAQLLGQDTLLRIHLQSAAMKSVPSMPLQGYGPGHIRDALACSKLSTPDLVRVCKLHLEFTSSHNIYLDRLLAFGWLGGLSFALLIGYALYRGYRSEAATGFALVSSLLLISLYYFTNVTTPEVELLAWALLLYLLFGNAPTESPQLL